MAKIPLAQRQWIVYWLYDDKCVCYLRHGYIGATSNWRLRIIKHRRNKRFPSGFKWIFLFRGTKAECKQLEWQMRPRAFIGWNLAPGGGAGHTNRGRIGQKKPDEERRKISLAHLGKKLSPEHNAAFQSGRLPAAHTGHHHSDETKQTISRKKTGVPIHSDEEKARRSKRWKGNTLTKGKPWSAARRLAWLQKKERDHADLVCADQLGLFTE